MAEETKVGLPKNTVAAICYIPFIGWIAAIFFFLTEKEAFIKEYLNDENMSRIRAQKNGEQILKGKKKYDPVIRHTFVEGNISVKDEYVNLAGVDMFLKAIGKPDLTAVPKLLVSSGKLPVEQTVVVLE